MKILVSDLPAVADQLEVIAEVELEGLGWDEPQLVEAARCIKMARNYLHVASSLINDVKNGL